MEDMKHIFFSETSEEGKVFLKIKTTLGLSSIDTFNYIINQNLALEKSIKTRDQKIDRFIEFRKYLFEKTQKIVEDISGQNGTKIVIDLEALINKEDNGNINK